METAWGVFATAADPHVVPLDDLREHSLDCDCWCGPSPDDGVMVHHSMDQREFYEQGDRQPS